ncbi:MAG: ribose-5-phosphate isomerase RpiA [Lachnospiraceae bacterium]|nr:ribose-5-phosphate isomerase RpiA [Lachnospiraceae bacterium]MDY5742534.1 ribose-5-phosphate isomerase RpiA [Lachnospiraceae bacterium]
MNQKQIAGEAAAALIQDGMVVGLGTGSTAFYMIQKLGEMVKNGLSVTAVATSAESARLAEELGITVLDVNEVDHIDIDIDGVDEIDPDGNVIKGGGGALLREKIVSRLAKETVWVMDAGKEVAAIGAFPLPVEIVRYGHRHTLKAMEDAGLSPVLRVRNDETYLTDNGNYIADLHLGAPIDIPRVVAVLAAIPGVVEHGLFLGMGSQRFVGTDAGVMSRKEKK